MSEAVKFRNRTNTHLAKHCLCSCSCFRKNSLMGWVFTKESGSAAYLSESCKWILLDTRHTRKMHRLVINFPRFGQWSLFIDWLDLACFPSQRSVRYWRHQFENFAQIALTILSPIEWVTSFKWLFYLARIDKKVCFVFSCDWLTSTSVFWLVLLYFPVNITWETEVTVKARWW